METERRNQPRKVPQQARSKATVEAILQATAYILIEDGYRSLTTNRVAERAGVNISSLYQFFPDKDALVVELKRRHEDKTHEAMQAVLERHSRGGPDALLRAMVESYVAAHAIDPALQRVLAEELPRLDADRRSAAATACRSSAAHAFFAPWQHMLPDPELSIWMVSTICDAAVQRALSERPADLQSGLFVEELVFLLQRYLRRRPPARPVGTASPVSSAPSPARARRRRRRAGSHG